MHTNIYRHADTAIHTYTKGEPKLESERANSYRVKLLLDNAPDVLEECQVGDWQASDHGTVVFVERYVEGETLSDQVRLEDGVCSCVIRPRSAAFAACHQLQLARDEGREWVQIWCIKYVLCGRKRHRFLQGSKQVSRRSKGMRRSGMRKRKSPVGMCVCIYMCMCVCAVCPARVPFGGVLGSLPSLSSSSVSGRCALSVTSSLTLSRRSRAVSEVPDPYPYCGSPQAC